MKKAATIKYRWFFLLLLLPAVSCKKYLDVLPDNRAELNTSEKIAKMMVSAYSTTIYVVPAEISSDNMDDYGKDDPNTNRMYDEIFFWKDVTETGNDSPKSLWSGCYSGIASSNEVLNAIKEAGNPVSLNPVKGEALVARAYNHFVLVNMFAQHYTKKYGATDLGIPYMTSPEQTLDPKYKRNSVAEVYDLIKKDLEEGLPLIDDRQYGNTPKFHFNKAAANAFAARVYLYTQDWEKAIAYANAAIGVNPAGNLRDNAYLSNLTGEVEELSKFYTGSNIKANLMIQPASSEAGLVYGRYKFGTRYSHGTFILRTETFGSLTPWGSNTPWDYVLKYFSFEATNFNKALVPRLPYRFETTDPVAGIGFSHTVYASFTTEETLLTRAEAYVHLGQYDKALSDTRYWIKNSLSSDPGEFTTTTVNQWADGLAYFTPRNPTPKKKLNPEFVIRDKTEENMLHFVLFIRRLETMHTGLRWFDVKRYGIEITRRVIVSGKVGSTDDANTLKTRDNRMAMQLPQDVINAGMQKNPR